MTAVDWLAVAPTVAQIAVAVGTGALAFFTWRLALSTRTSVEEMREERKLTQRALDASNRLAAAAEGELAASKEQVAATATLALEAVRERSARWEPHVTARLEQRGRSRPASATLENLGPGPAIDAVYVALVRDEVGLSAWFQAGPLNLLGGERVKVELTCTYGIEQGAFQSTDETTLEQGRRMRRHYVLYVRAFGGDARMPPRLTERAWLGLEMPPAVLFHGPLGPLGRQDWRQEAFVCICTNGHIHRVLPHLRLPQEQFAADDPQQTWIAWYMRGPRHGLDCPEIPAMPDAKLIKTEPI